MATLAEAIASAAEHANEYETCMGLYVSEDGKSVELLLDTARDYWGEWIPGEGGDICLYRDRETNKVMGVHLPLYNERLCVHYRGPIRIAGFRRSDSE